MARRSCATPGGLAFNVLPFVTDSRLPARITSPPAALDEKSDNLGPAARTRRFALNMGGGSRTLASGGTAMHGHGGGMVGSGVSDFGINGRPYALERIDFAVPIGSVERWVIGGGGAIEHPFHVHGVRFRVLSEGGRVGPSPQNRGWKDVVLVTGETEILARFDHPTPAARPDMFHCHILEHEDAGMMGQFTVG